MSVRSELPLVIGNCDTLAHVPRLGRYLVIETQPVLILMTAIGGAVTLIYAVAAVAAIVLHAI